MLLPLKLIGYALLAIVAVFMIYCIILTIIYAVKSIKKELKGGADNDRNNKP